MKQQQISRLINNLDMLLFALGLIVILISSSAAGYLYQVYCNLLQKDIVILNPLHNPVNTLTSVIFNFGILLMLSAVVVFIMRNFKTRPKKL